MTAAGGVGRVGDLIAAELSYCTFSMLDRADDGRTLQCRWDIVECEGEPGAAARSAGVMRRVTDTVTRLREAARGTGHFYLTGHGIPEPVFGQMLMAAKRFFALPLDAKMRVYIGNSANHRGYVPEGEEVFVEGVKDAKEAYDLSLDLSQDDPDYRAGNPLLGPNQWPGLPGFAADVRAYYEATFNVGRVLMRGFAMAMGEAPERFDRMLSKPPSQLRLILYPCTLDASDRPGIGAHTDFECFTLLKSTAPGLEVLDLNGNWVDVPPLPRFVTPARPAHWPRSRGDLILDRVGEREPHGSRP